MNSIVFFTDEHESMRVRPGLPGSTEALMHAAAQLRSNFNSQSPGVFALDLASLRRDSSSEREHNAHVVGSGDLGIAAMRGEKYEEKYDERRRVLQLGDALEQPRLQRAIGVIYRPATERMSHYYYCSLLNQVMTYFESLFTLHTSTTYSVLFS